MKLIIFTFFVFVSFKPYAQSSLKPIVNLGYTYLYPLDNLWIHEVHIGGGAQFDDHFSLQLNIKGMQNARDLSSQKIKEPLRIVVISISPYNRILKPKYIVSPAIGLDLGTQVWSNGNGRFISSDYSFKNSSNLRYERGIFFGKAKLLADFKINSFNLMIGPTFNIMYFKTGKVKTDWMDNSYFEKYIDERRGIGLELSLMYTFPMKKRSLDELENRD